MKKVLQIAVFGNESISRSVRSLIRAENPNLEVVLTLEEDVYDHGRNSSAPEMYTMNPARKQVIRKALTKDLDWVVVAHNLGSGVCRAQIIPDRLLDRTIVVLERRSPDIIHQYKECGITHFSMHSKLGKKILTLLESLEKVAVG